MRIVLNVCGVVSGILLRIASCGVRVMLKRPISCIRCATSFHRFATSGQFHRTRIRVPVWLQFIKQRDVVLVWNLVSLSGIKYHLSVILFVSSHKEVILVPVAIVGLRIASECLFPSL